MAAAGETGEFHDHQRVRGEIFHDTFAPGPGCLAGNLWIMAPGLVRGDVQYPLSTFPRRQVKGPYQTHFLFPRPGIADDELIKGRAVFPRDFGETTLGKDRV